MKKHFVSEYDLRSEPPLMAGDVYEIYLASEADAHITEIKADHAERVTRYMNALDEKDTRIADLESGLRELLQDTQHANHNCGDGPDLCPVMRAKELLGL